MTALINNWCGEAELIRLSNSQGMECSLSNFGARITSIRVPDSTGKHELTVSPADFQGHLHDPYYGAAVGRVAGRIAGGKFSLNDHHYCLLQNEGTNTLHGGPDNFSRKMWEIDTLGNDYVSFSLKSPAGENGFPGNLRATVTYHLTESDELIIEYGGRTDAPTLYNPTNHVYFNLHGKATKSIADHILKIEADAFVRLNQDNTAGAVVSVENTLFDFRQGQRLDAVIFEPDKQVMINCGLNHPFLIKKGNAPQLVLSNPAASLRVEMETSQDSVVVYTTGNGQVGADMTTGTMTFAGGIALEAQMLPGSEQNPDNKVIFLPEEEYRAVTKYRFIF